MLQENLSPKTMTPPYSQSLLEIETSQHLANLSKLTHGTITSGQLATSLDDQPRYSYNKTYLFAKKIGFPTEFEL
jgi:hypothetical protein